MVRAGDVQRGDVLTVLAQWGQPGSADLDGNGLVDVNDLLTVLAAYGGC